jgi:predicted TIM-barrel fold metal-dependent hydrolase
VIDCHFHVWTTDVSTPEARAERAEMVRREAEHLGVERIALIGEVDNTVAACREHNRTVAQFVEEHPALFYGWARVDPRLGEEAVSEFRRAVEEDGLVGLKHHFYDGTPVNISDPEFFPLAEAAVEMDVPIIAHVMQRTEADKEHWDDSEAYTEDVRELAERYPDLDLISAHILGGGDPEYRIRNLRDLDNVILDVSGSVCDAGILEMAAEELGTDRLVFGTDTWLVPGVGKLEGCGLTPERKAEIAYNFEDLVGEHVPNRLSPAEIEAGRERARERFAAIEAGDYWDGGETVDANAYLGRWPFRPLVDGGTAGGLIERMDETGIDRAVVSATGAVTYRNVHHANRELRDAVEGHRDRLIPLATINPAYTAWRDDLAECVEWGFEGVRLLPTYHDYDPDHPEAKELLRACADRDLPVFLAATLEDHRGRHPRHTLRGFEGGDSKYWTDDHVDAIVDLLRDCPDGDVVIADAWTSAPEIVEAVCESTPQGVRLDNYVREGRTLFVLDDLYCYFGYQAADIVEDVGVDRLVFGPELPVRIPQATRRYVDALPIDEDERDRVLGGNVLGLFD